MSLFAAVPFYNQGNVAGGLIGGSVFAVNAQFAHIFTVIRGNDNSRFIVNALLFENIEDFSDQIVRIGDTAVVTVYNLF